MEVKNFLFFVATFADGVQICQNEVDRSETTDGRNCYFDVIERQKTVPLICFAIGASGYPTFAVDLRDGHFEVNGVPYFQHSEPLRDFRLVYFRNVTQHRTVSVASGSSVDTADVGYDIGWETEYKGERISRIIRV